MTDHATIGVCLVTGAYYPEVSGGGLQARTLARALQGSVRCTVLTTTTDRTLPRDDRDEDIPVHRVYVRPDRPFSKVAAAARMATQLVRMRRHVDVIHLHGFSQKNWVVMGLAKLLRKPVVQKLTSLGIDDPASLPSTVGGRLQRWCYGQTDRLVAVSPALMHAVLDSPALRGRATLIANGVDVERFHPVDDPSHRAELRQALGLPAEAHITLFVGFCSRDKDPLTLWRAWRSVQWPEGVEPSLLFVGSTQASYHEIDQSLVAQLRREIAEAGREQHVRFIERAEEITRYYQAADAFVMPSRREGLPNALLEAMATALPCIAARLPGITDWVIEDGRTGLLFEPGDVEALTNALQRLVDDPAQAIRLGARADQTIVERFAIARIAAQYRALYQGLANGHASSI